MTRSLPLPPELAARYVEHRVLGSGAQGTVYRAEDRLLGRTVALKLFRSSRLPAAARRFQREAMVLARCTSPHLLAVYDHGETPAGAYMVLEFVAGGSAESLLDRPRDVDEVLPGMLDVVEALECLHRAGVVHRDVKPQNLLLVPGEGMKLADLGLARIPNRTALTGTGAVVGTPRYLAPEVLQRAGPTPASDVYSWGATLFHLLEGRTSIEEDDFFRICQGARLPPLRFRRVAAGSPVAELLRACLAEDPAARPTSRREMEGILAGVSVALPVLAPEAEVPRRPARLVAALVVATFLAGWGAAPVPESPPVLRVLAAAPPVARPEVGNLEVLGGVGYRAHRDRVLHDLEADRGRHGLGRIGAVLDELRGLAGDVPPDLVERGLVGAIEHRLAEATLQSLEFTPLYLDGVGDPLALAGALPPGWNRRRAEENLRTASELAAAGLETRLPALLARGPRGRALGMILAAQVLEARDYERWIPDFSRGLRPGPSNADDAAWEALALAAASPWFRYVLGIPPAHLETFAALRRERAERASGAGLGEVPTRALGFLVDLEVALRREEVLAEPAELPLEEDLAFLAEAAGTHPGWVDLVSTWALAYMGRADVMRQFSRRPLPRLWAPLRDLRARARAAGEGGVSATGVAD